MSGAADLFEAAEHPDLCAGKSSSFAAQRVFLPKPGRLFIPRVPGAVNPKSSTLTVRNMRLAQAPAEFLLIKKILGEDGEGSCFIFNIPNHLNLFYFLCYYISFTCNGWKLSFVLFCLLLM